MKPKIIMNKYIEKINNACQFIDCDAIMAIYNVLVNTNEVNGKIYICGNGGSASTASHFQSDLNCAFSISKKTAPAVCLNDNISVITAVSNDFSYDDVFLYQLQYLLKKSDVLIAISGSGNSTNIIKAAEYAKERGNTIISLVGFDGGKLKKISDFSFHVPVNNMQISEDMHLVFCHLVSTMIKEGLQKEDA